jgi:hypothetical protein
MPIINLCISTHPASGRKKEKKEEERKKERDGQDIP